MKMVVMTSKRMLRKKVCKNFVFNFDILRLYFIQFKVKFVKITKNSVASYVLREISLILITKITTVISFGHSVLKRCKIISFNKTIYVELNLKLKTLYCFK